MLVGRFQQPATVNLAVVWVFGPFFRARGLTGPADLWGPLALTFLGSSLVLCAAGLRVLCGEFSRPPQSVAPAIRQAGAASA